MIDSHTGSASKLTQGLFLTVMLKKEMSFSICHLIYVPNFPDGHDLLVVARKHDTVEFPGFYR